MKDFNIMGAALAAGVILLAAIAPHDGKASSGIIWILGLVALIGCGIYFGATGFGNGGRPF